MNAGRFVGRVGGLAVALGVGAAAATFGQAVAWADDTAGSGSSAGASSSSAEHADSPSRARKSASSGTAKSSPRATKSAAQNDSAAAAAAESPATGSGADPVTDPGSATTSRYIPPAKDADVSGPVRQRLGSSHKRATAPIAVAPDTVQAPPSPSAAQSPADVADHSGPVDAVQPPAAAPAPVYTDAAVIGSAAPVQIAQAAARAPESASASVEVASGAESDSSLLGGNPAAPLVNSAMLMIAVAARRAIDTDIESESGDTTEDVVGTGLGVDEPAVTGLTLVEPSNRDPKLGSPWVNWPNSSTGVVTGKITGTDADRDPLHYYGAAGWQGGPLPSLSAKGGTVLVNGSTGEFTYTPTDAARHAASQVGAPSSAKTDTFTITVDDGVGGTATKVITVTVVPKNSAPTLTPVVNSPNPDTGVVTGTLGAHDADGDALTFKASPRKGTIAIAADGTFTYTPTAAARHAAAQGAWASTKVDTFTVTATDGHGGTVTKSVTVSIAPDNAAPQIVSVEVRSISQWSGAVTGKLNVTDTDKDRLTYSGTANYGKVRVSSNGTFTYTPTSAARHAASGDGPYDDEITLTVSDGHGGTTVLNSLSLTILPRNNAPSAWVSVKRPESALGIVLGKVSGWDSDGDTLTYSTTNASKGTVALNEMDGGFNYHPTQEARHLAAKVGAPNSAKYDTFEVTIDDGHGGITTKTVTVAISPKNSAPTVAATPTISAPDANTGIVTGSVGASDADGDPLTFKATPRKGAITFNGQDGSFTYTPTAKALADAAKPGAWASTKVDTFTVSVSDGFGGTTTKSITVSLVKPTAPNTAPNAVNDGPFTTNEDTPVTLTGAQLVGNDTDPNSGDVLSVHSVSGATNGTAVLNANGSVTFTPTANYNGSASFTYKVKDGAGAVSANGATVTVTVTPVNDAPTAVNDGPFTTAMNNPITLTGAQLVGNDTDPDAGDALSVHSVSGATGGTAVLNANGSVTFTPTTNYSGTASFSYKVKDAAGAASTNNATVSLTVTPGNLPPTAVNDSATIAEDQTRTFTAAELVGNDTDPNSGDVLSVHSVGNATNGTAVLNGNGSVTFTPTANFNGTASFTYKVKDAAGAVSSNNATVSITVTPVNDAPTGVNDGPFTVAKNTPITLTRAQLVGNDIDPDTGDTLSIASLGGRSNGSVVLNADGSVTFTPNTDYTGTDAWFIYRVKDAAGATSTIATDAKVSFNVVDTTPVNQPPTGVNDSATIAEDQIRTFTAAELVGNDTDPNSGDVLSVHSVSGATNGTAVLNANGSVTFTPTANFNGTASFTYKVKDTAGAVSSNNATMTITVTPVNDAPTAVNDGPFTTTSNTPITLTGAQLVGNDTDPDTGDALSVHSITGATGGTAVLNANGSVTFTPTANYTGAASFSYKVKDTAGAASTNNATVNLTVTQGNLPPTGVNDSATIAEDQTRTFTAAELVGNDTDPNSGDVLSVHSVSGATNGTVVLNGNGSVTFTPTANFNGTASFTYKVKDTAGAVSTNNATMSITVTPVNDAPTAVNDSGFTTTKNTPLTLAGGQLVGNDTDPDTGDALSVHSITGATGGTAVLNANGSVTFTPTANYTGAASFTYKVKDTAGAASTNNATVNLTVTAPANTPPIGVNDGPFTLSKNTARVFTFAELVGNDIDADGDVLSVVGWGGGNHVGIAIDSVARTVTVTPETGYTGAASFIYRVGDSAGNSSGGATDATVTLNVVDNTPVNQPPVAVNDTGFSTGKNSPLTLTGAQLVGNDHDPDANVPLRVYSVGNAVNGNVVLNANGSVTFTPTANYSGAASFTYNVADAAGAVSTTAATVSINVTAANMTVVGAITDNYKDWDAPGGTREYRAWLQVGSLVVNGVTYDVTTPGATTYNNGADGITVHGSNNTTGTLTMVTTDPRVTHAWFRSEPTGQWGPRIDMETPSETPGLWLPNPLPANFATISVDLVLTVGGVEIGRTTLEYRYDAAIYNAAYPSIEFLSSGGRWWVNGSSTPLDWQNPPAVV